MGAPVNRKLLVLFFAFQIVPILLSAYAQSAPAVGKKFLVVIDPGHGGKDTGAVFREAKQRFTEKALTLLLARDLARELIIRGINVILTRNDDREMMLSDRTALANKLKADVFISIHLNSSAEKIRAGGVETFILNHATDDSSRRLADLENAVLKDSQANGVGSSNVSLIMKDLILDSTLVPSKELACSVQGRIKAGARDRGVKQALFYVLLGADMPSILIEAGFLSSKMDRDRIIQTKSRLGLAAQIAAAIDDYRHKRRNRKCEVMSEKQFQRPDEVRRPKHKI